MSRATTSIQRVDKPWGHEEIWARTDTYVGKVLVIKAGHRLSLQHHEQKEETIRVATGELSLELEDEQGQLIVHHMKPGDVAHIAPGRRHRMAGITDVSLYEVSTTQLGDVVRHEDDYGRA